MLKLTLSAIQGTVEASALQIIKVIIPKYNTLLQVFGIN